MQLEQILIVDSLPSGRETIEWALERAGVAAETFASLDGWSPGERSSQVAIVSLRTTDLQELGAIKRLVPSAGKRYAPVLALGPDSAREKAQEAGAALFLSTPLYVRDAVNAARIMAVADGDVSGPEFEVRARLAIFDGLYQLVRTLLSLQRSFIVELRSGRHRGELRFVAGMLSAAHLNNLQGTTALHRMLLWDDGDLVLRARNQVRRSGQFAANPETLILEADRFLRDFAHEAADLGTARTVYQQELTKVAQGAVHVPEEVSPVFRLFDGQRDLGAVMQDSPFPVFDTIRIIRRLVQAGALVPRRAPEGAPFSKPRDEASGVLAIAGWNERDQHERTPAPLLEPRRKRKITASRLIAERPSVLDDGPITPPPQVASPLPVSGELVPRGPAGQPVDRGAKARQTAPTPVLSSSPASPARGGTPAPQQAKAASAVRTAPGPLSAGPSLPARTAGLGPVSSPLLARPPSTGAPQPTLARPPTTLKTALPAAPNVTPPTPVPTEGVPTFAEPRARTSATISTVAGEIGSRPSRSHPAVAPLDEGAEGRAAEIRSGEIKAPLPLIPNASRRATGTPQRAPSVVVDAAQMPAPVPLEAPSRAPVSMAEVAGASAAASTQPAPAPTGPAPAAGGTPRPLTPGPSGASRRLRNASAANAFDEVEADFFAREADLYRHHVVEDFGDLEDEPAPSSDSTPRRKP